MESVSPTAGTEQNDHHCIPRSFLGSVHDSNITRLPVTEHNAFHQITGHRPPNFLMKKAMLASIGWHDDEGKTIPVSVLEDTLQYLTPADWKFFYDREAIFEPTEVPSAKSATLAAIHIHSHLWEEQAMLADAITCISTTRYISYQTNCFLKNIMSFFRADIPTQAVHTYLTEVNHQEERKWTKPIMPKPFSVLCDLTKEVTPELLTTHTRKRLIEALFEHHKCLTNRVETWEPSIGSNTAKLAEHGQVLMETFLERGKRRRINS